MMNRRNSLMAFVDPFEAMGNLNSRIFDAPFFSEDAFSTLGSFGTDITDEGDHYELTADLPGFDKDDIKIDVKDGSLIVDAERHSEMEDKDKEKKFIRKERSYGRYQRAFTLKGIREDDIRAKYENGILTVKLPKMEEIPQRKNGSRIEIE